MKLKNSKKADSSESAFLLDFIIKINHLLFSKNPNQPPFDFINIASLEIHLYLCYNKYNESAFTVFMMKGKEK